eukprot:6190232-Pleurochrysis_carterae.AAC.3
MQARAAFCETLRTSRGTALAPAKLRIHAATDTSGFGFNGTCVNLSQLWPGNVFDSLLASCGHRSASHRSVRQLASCRARLDRSVRSFVRDRSRTHENRMEA